MIKWLTVCSIVLFISCTNNTKVPKDVIPKAKMEKVLWDMMLADRFAADFLKRPGDSAYSDTAVFKVYQKVFNIHGITKDDFLKSYKFYLNHPDIARVMFDSISVQAERKKADVYSRKAKLDSLKLHRADTTAGKRRLDSMRRRLMSDSLRNTLRKQ